MLQYKRLVKYMITLKICHTKKMKTTLFLFLICLMILSFYGCNQKDSTNKLSKQQWSSDISYSFGSSQMALSENKIVYIENSILRIMDLDSEQSTVLCTYPDCKHEFDTQGNSTCEAAPPGAALGDFVAVGFHTNTIFQFFVSEEDVTKTLVYTSRVGQQGRKLVATIPYSFDTTSNIFFKENYMYCAASVLEFSDEGFSESGHKCVILRMNLDTYALEELTTVSDENFVQIKRLDFDGNLLVYEVIRKKASSSEEENISVFSYNLETQEEKTIYDNFFNDGKQGEWYIGYENQNIYYNSTKDHAIMKQQIDDKESEIVIEITDNRMNRGGAILYNSYLIYDLSDYSDQDYTKCDYDCYFYHLKTDTLYKLKDNCKFKEEPILANENKFLCINLENYSLHCLPMDDYTDEVTR